MNKYDGVTDINQLYEDLKRATSREKAERQAYEEYLKQTGVATTNANYGIAAARSGKSLWTAPMWSTNWAITDDPRDISMFENGELVMNEETRSVYVKVTGCLLRLPEMRAVDLRSIDGHDLIGIGTMEDLANKIQEKFTPNKPVLNKDVERLL